MSKLNYKLIIGLILSFIFPFFLIRLISFDNILIPSIAISLLSFIISFFLKKYKNIFYIIIYVAWFINLIIIPYSFYVAWFQIITTKIPVGIISNNLLFLIFYIWGLCLGQISFKNILTFSILLLLLYSFINSSIFILLALILLILLRSFIFLFNKKRVKYLKTILLMIIFSSVISFFIFTISSINGSTIIDESSYNFRKGINKLFPDFELLTTIPGLTNSFSSYTGKPPLLTTNNILKIKGTPGSRYYLRLKIGTEVNDDEFVTFDSNLKEISNNSIEITVLTDFLPVLPTTLNTESISYYSINDIINKTIKPNIPLSKGDKIILNISEQINNKQKIENKNIQNLFTNSELKKLAETLRGTTNLETANNIRKYLFTNYTYNLETKESVNYITEFLFNTHEGFCTHFTRSFIILANLNGIISREISGYLVDIPYDIESNEIYNNFENGIAYITGKDAHLWPEIFINDRWITFEVTPSEFREDKSTNITVVESKDIKSSIPESTNKINNYYFLLILLLIPIIILILIYRFNNNLYFKRIINKYMKKGIPHPDSIGWVEWNNLVTNNKDIEKLLLNTFYNKKQLNKESFKIIKRLL